MLHSSSSERNGKTSKKLLFWAQFSQKRIIMSHAQNEKQLFGRNNKSRSSASTCFGRVMFFYLEWCFLSKKCHFQVKQISTFIFSTFPNFVQPKTPENWPSWDSNGRSLLDLASQFFTVTSYNFPWSQPA